MSTIFGVVNKPLFDVDLFKSGQPIHVIDYVTGSEYSSIIVKVNPMYLDILSYDKPSDKAVFSSITVDQFIEGLYEIKALVTVDLEEANKEKVEYSTEDLEVPEKLEDVESFSLTESDSFTLEVKMSEPEEIVESEEEVVDVETYQDK